MQGAAVTAPAEECDVAIIGGGGDGLTAAALLARKRLRVLVLERNPRPGGRLVTREFHPGYRASPFQDEVAPIPAELHWSLDLGRRGVLFLPARLSTAVWLDRLHCMEEDRCGMQPVGARHTAEVLRWAENPGQRSWLERLLNRHAPPAPQAGNWSFRSLASASTDSASRPEEIAHRLAAAAAGRPVDPFLAGTALHLLAPGIGTSGTVPGGMGRLGEALADCAIEAGAEILCGTAVSEIRFSGGRARGVVLADGAPIKARTVISTLDAKCTFLGLFKWDALPKAIAMGAQNFRAAGGTARILLALSRAPQLANGSRELLRGPIFVAPEPDGMRKAYAAWRAQVVPESPPIAARVVSATDPSLAPIRAAAMTVTVGCVPYHRLDGPWCFSKRDHLRANILAHLERVFPGITQTVVGWEVLAPQEIEDQLGATAGDLGGGEIAPDQMLDLRPGFGASPPRTFLRGLYLAGKSTPAGPLATGLAGAMAARAVLADLGRR